MRWEKFEILKTHNQVKPSISPKLWKMKMLSHELITTKDHLVARVLFKATFSLLEQTAVLALRFVCATNVMILRTRLCHFTGREAPTESPVLKWSSADSSWTLRNSRSIVAQGATLRHGALSSLPLPLLWQGKATGTQSRGPDCAGAGPPDCSSADFPELQATSARGRARPPTTKRWARDTFLGS